MQRVVLFFPPSHFMEFLRKDAIGDSAGLLRDTLIERRKL